MQRLQAFKFELMPSGEQQRSMRRFVGSCRVVFNEALRLQQTRYTNAEKKLGYAQLCKQLTDWRSGRAMPSGRVATWLKDAPIHPLQQTLKHLERGYVNFFEGRASFPQPKKKGRGDSFRYPDAKQFEIDQANSRLKLPKLGWMRYRNSREILGTAKNITVSQSGGKWFASIQTEREVEKPVPVAITAIGIDVGIARFATMSDGSFVAPLSSFKKHENRLAKYQRRMSRKVKFSKNWHKAKRKVQQIHSTISNTRKDFLHKTTAAISKNHALVAVEDLQVRNMSKSAVGTVEKAGKNVAQKSGLNKAILDQGWFEFRRQLDYKLEWKGGILVAVPPQYTSQTCPCCDHVAKENRQTQAKFECVDCGYENNADVVGAINILARGHRVLACGEDVRRAKVARPKRANSKKQEPTEATLVSSNADESAVGIPSL
ncbi:MAG: hypothetical protein RIR79_1105 [Pseudomonadota bacterium]